MEQTIFFMVSQMIEMSISLVALIHQRPAGNLIPKRSRVFGQRMERQTVDGEEQKLANKDNQNII